MAMAELNGNGHAGNGNVDRNDRLHLCNYIVDKVLGVGGEGIVFAVTNKEDSSKSAIKIIELEDGANEKQLREIQFHQKVSNHFSIVTMLDYCIDSDGSGVRELLRNMRTDLQNKVHEKVHLTRAKTQRAVSPAFLAIRMQLYECNLLTWMQADANRLSPRGVSNATWERNRLRIFRQILQGIDHIHRNGLLHRDGKPENVFVDTYQKVRVGDFGSAISHEDYTAQLTHSSKQGTPLYWAPELACGGKYGPEVDLYPLGLILGELMFDVDEKDRYKFMHNGKYERTFPDSPINFTCDIERVKILVLTMTEKRPVDRMSLKHVISETGDIVGSMNQRVSH